MRQGGWELVASDEPTIFAKPLLDAIVVKDGQSDGCLADSTCTNESDWSEVFRKPDDRLDQLSTSETSPR